ncbi:MAG: 1-acyl-sn-glycerol-3-phosphate acyltransferase, partial [Burkholderiaceae bacterium]|nr:1-acyl-sn-glycerol-3-phosphate acyltransferase [Burkholderiaceae bacterium]
MIIWLDKPLGQFAAFHLRSRFLQPRVIDQPVVILSKHQSAWETIAFLQIFP